MAASNGRTPEQVRLEIEAERDQLVGAVEELRTEIGEATDVGAKLRAHLPVAAAATLGARFFVAGGIGATMRLLARRGGRLSRSHANPYAAELQKLVRKGRGTDELVDRKVGASAVIRAGSDTPRQLDGDSIGAGRELRMKVVHGRVLVRVPR